MFWRWLSRHFLDLFNLAIAATALLISFGGYLIARDSSDIKDAVKNISALETQTKRQRDGITDHAGSNRMPALELL